MNSPCRALDWPRDDGRTGWSGGRARWTPTARTTHGARARSRCRGPPGRRRPRRRRRPPGTPRRHGARRGPPAVADLAAHPAARAAHRGLARTGTRRARPEEPGRLPAARAGRRRCSRRCSRLLAVVACWRNGCIPLPAGPAEAVHPGRLVVTRHDGAPDVEGADALDVYDGVFFGVLVYGSAGWAAGRVVRRYVAGRGRACLAAGHCAWRAAGRAPRRGWTPCRSSAGSTSSPGRGGDDLPDQPSSTALRADHPAVCGRSPASAAGATPGSPPGRAGRRAEPRPRPGRPAPAAAVARAARRRAARGRRPLAAEVRAGRMNDVDYARIAPRLAGRADAAPDGSPPSPTPCCASGAAACAHPSGARDLPAPHRPARPAHRPGPASAAVADDARNPYAYRGAGLALGPRRCSAPRCSPSARPGPGKTAAPGPARRRVARACRRSPGGAAVVAVGAAGRRARPGRRVRRRGRGSATPPPCTTSTCTAAPPTPTRPPRVLAEAPGRRPADRTGGDSRRAATALAQLLGPYRAVHGRFPSVPELRELLDGDAGRARPRCARRCGRGGHAGACSANWTPATRQTGAPGDAGPRARRPDRAARPARLRRRSSTHRRQRPAVLAARRSTTRCGSGSTCPSAATPRRRGCSPGWSSPSSPRVVAARADRSLFACLVLDDATRTVTAEAVRGIQRLRSAQRRASCSTLRTLDDVPEALRGAAARRGRLPDGASPGVTTWDGRRFAEAWGTEWVETRDVTDRAVFADQPLTRAAPRAAQAGHRQGGDHGRGDRAAGRAGALVRVRAGARGARRATRCCR